MLEHGLVVGRLVSSEPKCKAWHPALSSSLTGRVTPYLSMEPCWEGSRLAVPCQHGCGLQEEDRQELLRGALQLTEVQMQDVARVCNRYPDIQLGYKIAGEGGKPVPVSDANQSVPANSTVAIQVDLTRDQAGDLRPVDAPRY